MVRINGLTADETKELEPVAEKLLEILKIDQVTIDVDIARSKRIYISR